MPHASIGSRTVELAPFITRVTLENYKSFVSSDVRLQPLTFLVGRNGAGKSNFLDAFSFLADSLRGTFDEAVRQRGGFAAVSHLTAGIYPGISMRLEFTLRDGRTGSYRFAVSPRSFGEPFAAPTLASEECQVSKNDGSGETDYFKVTNSDVLSNITPMPSAPRDRLYLVNASGIAPFEAVYDELSTMRIYRFGRHNVEDGRVTGEESVLAWDGSNLAGVLLALEKQAPHILNRIQAYLRLIVPELENVYVFPFGANQYIGFRQSGQPGELPHQHGSAQMSEGTVRALCVLVALFQGAAKDPRSP
jgi:predicted ATPase